MKIKLALKPRFALVIALLTILVISSVYLLTTNTKAVMPAGQAGITSFTASQLAEYDGTDPHKPIYIAMDGLVYDVTAGKSYYQSGGSYHYLAGRDSTADLHIAGGGLIKRKYPVIGRLQTD